MLFFFVQLTGLFHVHLLRPSFIVPIDVIYCRASRQLFHSLSNEKYTTGLASIRKFYINLSVSGSHCRICSLFITVMANIEDILVIPWSKEKIRTILMRHHPILAAKCKEILERGLDIQEVNKALRKEMEHPESILYGENTFYFDDCETFSRFLRLHPRAPRLFRKIIIDHVINSDSTSYSFDALAHVLEQCQGLEEVEIGVDESSLVKLLQKQRKDIGERGFLLLAPDSLDHQMNLIILPAVRHLRTLGIPKVTFTSTHKEILWWHAKNWPNERRPPCGPIAGGVLDKVVAPEMMQYFVKRKKENARKRKATDDAAPPTDDAAPPTDAKRPRREKSRTVAQKVIYKDGLSYLYSQSQPQQPQTLEAVHSTTEHLL